MKLNYTRYVYPLEAGRETYKVFNPENPPKTQPIVINSVREFREFREHLEGVIPNVQFVHVADNILGKQYTVS